MGQARLIPTLVAGAWLAAPCAGQDYTGDRLDTANWLADALRSQTELMFVTINRADNSVLFWNPACSRNPFDPSSLDTDDLHRDLRSSDSPIDREMAVDMFVRYARVCERTEAYVGEKLDALYLTAIAPRDHREGWQCLEPLGDLRLCFAKDFPDYIQYVTRRESRLAEMDDAELLDHVRANVDTILWEVHLDHDTVTRIELNTFTASLLHHDGFWDEMARNYVSVVAALPNRHILLVAEGNSRHAVEMLRQEVRRSFGEESRPVSLTLLRRVGTGWQVKEILAAPDLSGETAPLQPE
ncbi:MAG: hypothetical protein ACU0DK_09225 [Pseudooceanicola sp.]